MEKQKKIVPLIQWHDGMALSPHHFQQQELRNHQLLSTHFNHISFHHWGVQNLQIDKTVLPSGIFKIQYMEVIMPDSLIYKYSIEDENIKDLEINLEKERHNFIKGSLFVQLIVPSRVPGISPIVGSIPRFLSSEIKDINDENTDDNPINIPSLIPNFELFVGDIVPSKYVGFPIAKIKLEENAYKFDNFTPPCFYIEKHTEIYNDVSEVSKKIREKALAFSDKWQSQIGSNLLRETGDILRPLLTILPILETKLSNNFISPKDLYDELVRAVGFISQLMMSKIPQKFGNYNHNDINASIYPILEYISNCLDQVSLEYAIFPFIKNDRIFSFKIHSAYISDNYLLVGVKAKQGTNHKQVEEWMNNAVIVSDNAVQKVKEKRILGAERFLINDEQLYEMSPPRDTSIFKIRYDGVLINTGQYLHIFNQSDDEKNRPFDIVLYVPKFKKEKLNEAA